jgi:hypothetical protein
MLAFERLSAPCSQSDSSGQVAAKRQAEAIPAKTDLAVTVADVLGKRGSDRIGELRAAAGQDGRRWPAGGEA